MVLINIYFIFMFITALLQKIVSAPPKRPKIDRPSTSSTPFPPENPKHPPNYYTFLKEHPEKDVPSSTPSTSTRTSEPSKIPPEEDAYFLEERARCIREINAVFKENLSPQDHVKHAVINLTTQDPSLIGYAHPYYVSLASFLRKGNIPSVEKHCKTKSNYEECYNSITSVFKSNITKRCLIVTFYDLNEKIVQDSGNYYALTYFFKIRDLFKTNFAPNKKNLGYQKPSEYCDLLLKTSPRVNMNFGLTP